MKFDKEKIELIKYGFKEEEIRISIKQMKFELQRLAIVGIDKLVRIDLIKNLFKIEVSF